MSGDKTLSIFLENNQNEQHHEAAYYYKEPREIISVHDPVELKAGFARIEAALARGFHVAGWFSYEAGLCLEGKLKGLLPEKLDYPLIHMGVFKERQVFSSLDADHYWRGFENPTGYELSDIKLSLSREEYEIAFNQIQEYLKAGDIYQVNYTQKASFKFAGSPQAFYAALRNAQAVEYAAYIECEDLSVLSLSPELFVKKMNDQLIAKPMKGTCRRGRTIEEDQLRSEELLSSDKERAENLMIVDLLRNDLSKIAQSGSVSVTKLFDVEKYRTLFTMTSTIEAKLGIKNTALDVMTSIFPCGSVTGAPKIRAQQIIDELEKGQRGIYTGAIGYFTPSGDMCFSVPIRTITLNNEGEGELGIGGAVVADSRAEQEYDECLLKAQFVTKEHPSFALIESLLWTKDDGYRYMKLHMDRIESSASYFSFKFNRLDIIKQLEEHSKYLGTGKYKVRLLLSKGGSISISSIKVVDSHKPRNVILSREFINKYDPMRYHKTTDRRHYDEQLSKTIDCFDVLFMNEQLELTEGSYTNLFIEKEGVLYTPPQECGLLAGVMRHVIIEDNTIQTKEKKLFVEDLITADKVYLSNAVRGLISVNFINQDFN
ncbi:MAG: aminodeoxychorismate synthase component I [Kordiimonadaceae bacterium]|jgi:para-aminobenzoate synthetase / 4-amino-4-deoxychorismate lyase|nr:aminodeoxychorismate synthase component I [Kordiimonadaceae bacterium]MBT6032757.1 aminodeoxychorismate synthase component I [Kordiimonadaceae bacterium]